MKYLIKSSITKQSKFPNLSFSLARALAYCDIGATLSGVGLWMLNIRRNVTKGCRRPGLKYISQGAGKHICRIDILSASFGFWREQLMRKFGSVSKEKSSKVILNSPWPAKGPHYVYCCKSPRQTSTSLLQCCLWGKAEPPPGDILDLKWKLWTNTDTNTKQMHVQIQIRIQIHIQSFYNWNRN